MKKKNDKGITLIALVITIIVMLILVAVTVTVALNGGLFQSAKKAAADTEIAREAERELSNGKVNIDNTIYNSIDEYLGTTGGNGESTVDPEEDDLITFYINERARTSIIFCQEWDDVEGIYRI